MIRNILLNQKNQLLHLVGEYKMKIMYSYRQRIKKEEFMTFRRNICGKHVNAPLIN
jgi:hypothetical protein